MPYKVCLLCLEAFKQYVFVIHIYYLITVLCGGRWTCVQKLQEGVMLGQKTSNCIGFISYDFNYSGGNFPYIHIFFSGRF